MLSEIEHFIDWVRMRSPQAKTWRDYRCDLDLFLQITGDRNAAGILPRDVDRFVNYQMEQGYKPSTINRRVAAVASFYRYLIAEGLADASPVLARRHHLPQPQRMPRPVNERELRRFFSAVKGVEDRAMFIIMLHGGLRIGEISALELTDLYTGEQPPRLIVRGKGSRERTVYLSQQAGQAVKNWLAQRPVVPDPHVFLSYRHKRLSTTSIHNRLKHVCQTSGVHITAHRLRHTFADNLLSAGMPITSIQKLMGHRFVETTQNYALANDRQVQADFYQACGRLDGWSLFLSPGQEVVPNLGMGEEVGQALDEGCSQPSVDIPALFSRLPGLLQQQLEAYRQLKASRWRVERVAANSRSFYSLHGRLWQFFAEECGIKTASALQLEHVLKYVKDRLAAGRSARTLNVGLSSLRSFLSFLQEDQVEIHPSLDNLQRLKEDERLPRYMASGQVRLLENELEHSVLNERTPEEQYDALLLRTVFYLLWQGGLRSGEVELLRFSDFYISEANQAKRLFVRDGKWRKGRAVYLTDAVLQALKDYLALRGASGADDFVFVRNGRPLRKNFLSQRLKRIGRQVGVSVSPHRLRHTFATQLHNVGCRVTSIQKLLGHTNLNTTMTYARAFDQTVMLDYFQALDALEAQPDGAWFGLDEIPLSGP